MKKLMLIIFTVCMIFGFSLISSNNSYAKPGDESDPVIVLSYLNMRLDDLVVKYNLSSINNENTDINTESIQNSINDINARIDDLSTKISSVNNNNSDTNNNSENNNSETISKPVSEDEESTQDSNSGDNDLSKYLKYEIVELTPTDKLIAGESTEIILRMGTCTAIASKNGGLSDVTSGKDLTNEEVITANHLIIVPRADGRGLLAKTPSILMIKGDYEIEKADQENSNLTGTSSEE